jgi:hypothetical protein
VATPIAVIASVESQDIQRSHRGGSYQARGSRARASRRVREPSRPGEVVEPGEDLDGSVRDRHRQPEAGVTLRRPSALKPSTWCSRALRSTHGGPPVSGVALRGQQGRSSSHQPHRSDIPPGSKCRRREFWAPPDSIISFRVRHNQLRARTCSVHWRHIHSASRGVHHGSTSAITRGSARPSNGRRVSPSCRDFLYRACSHGSAVHTAEHDS